MTAVIAKPAEMTLEEWAALPEDDEGELVDGVLVEEEMPSFAHELVVTWVIHKLMSWLGERGFVGASEAKFGVAPRRGRKPDVSVYLPGSRKPEARGLVRTPPDILVEVVSPDPRDQRRDRVHKLAEYAAFGVRWYWLVDPTMRTFEILELDRAGRYAHAAATTDGPLTTVPGCEGLTLDVPALWAQLDRLDQDEPTGAEH